MGSGAEEMGLKCRDAASVQSDTEETLELVTENAVRHGLARATKQRLRVALGVFVALVAVALLVHSFLRELRDSHKLRLVTWNIAAINNNPFEYWISHDDADYNALMDNVQQFVDAPGARDVPVASVFPEERWLELKALMQAEGWSGVEETGKRWAEDFKARTIIGGFLKDESLGEKRLASMPDRVTNTINSKNQGTLYRPTVINCFEGDLSTPLKWWTAWKQFMFSQTLKLQGGADSPTRPAAMLQKIKRAKYKAVTAEEEAISIPLQTLTQAIFDAVLVHIVNEVSPTGKWQVLRKQMCDALNKHKDERTVEILADTYEDADIVFLQEAAASFLTNAEQSSLGMRYLIGHSAGLDAKRDQNSFILLRNDLFDVDSVSEHTEQVMSTFSKSVPVANGDLLVLSATDSHGRKYLLASFHGDTNGLATLPVLAAVHALASSKSDHTLIFGLDANTYEFAGSNKQDVLEFARDYVSKGYTSCWGDTPNPKNHTTFNARTFLQAQLQKAARASEKISKGDKNPKDFILFPSGKFDVLRTTKDNTGERRYVEDMVFPTLAFPSDHGVLSTELQIR